MKNGSLEWLLNWFYEHCDGDWEHDEGIQIGTLDNPGWYLTINLQDTELETKNFERIVIERSENDWLHCFVQDGKFEGPCGPFNLPEVIEIFREWVENCETEC
jgi:hypothetical protein